MSSYNPSSSKLRALTIILLIIGLPSLAMWAYMLGSVIVRDPDDVIAAVFLRNDTEQTAATRLPGGLHVTTAKLEGEAVIRCRTGREISLGYITGAWHLHEKVRAADCAARRT